MDLLITKTILEGYGKLESNYTLAVFRGKTFQEEHHDKSIDALNAKRYNELLK